MLTNLHDVSPTFIRLAEESYKRTAIWWFNQIPNSQTLPEGAQKRFSKKLIKTIEKHTENIWWSCASPDERLCRPLKVKDRISKNSIFAPALKTIGISRKTNPLPLDTTVHVYAGLVVKYPGHVIYSNKKKWLKIWREIGTKVGSWDGNILILNTLLTENQRFYGNELASPKELHKFIQRKRRL